MAKKKTKIPAVGQAEQAKNKEIAKPIPKVAAAERAKNKEIKTKPKVKMPIRPAVDKGTRTGRTRGEYGPNKSTEKDPNDRALIGSDRNRGKKIVRKPKPSGGSNTTTKNTAKKGSTKGTSKPKKGGGTPKRTPVTAPAPTQVPVDTIVRTQLKGVPVMVTPFSSNITEQQRDILYSFLTLSGTELFQYTNSRSIDGMFDNVSIISVLSSRRREYTPNTIIETMAPLIKNVWREGDILYIDVERATKGRRIVTDFYMSNISRIGSVEYV